VARGISPPEGTAAGVTTGGIVGGTLGMAVNQRHRRFYLRNTENALSIRTPACHKQLGCLYIPNGTSIA
jgi:hypothetical protein